ncbi:MAG: tRNA-Thr(GGU) m(6)t(6)A37 methyltransferase TsaA [Myxococcota bacterium]|jgi:tRNA-Thr(GGU) m(6)t(6)A37 methyltransferase TsaA
MDGEGRIGYTEEMADQTRDIPAKDYIDAVGFPQTVTLRPIGVVRSGFRERHGTPRQSTVSPLDGQPRRAIIELFVDQVPVQALDSLEGFEYIWVIAWLHLNRNWNPMVRPPREAKRKRGVLATRAPHRPNQLGLSATRLISVRKNLIEVEGIDLLDDTPVLDIKPYLPYADAFPDASAGWVDTLD